MRKTTANQISLPAGQAREERAYRTKSINTRLCNDQMGCWATNGLSLKVISSLLIVWMKCPVDQSGSHIAVLHEDPNQQSDENIAYSANNTHKTLSSSNTIDWSPTELSHEPIKATRKQDGHAHLNDLDRPFGQRWFWLLRRDHNFLVLIHGCFLLSICSLFVEKWEHIRYNAMMSTPMPATVVEELRRYLPLIELLSHAPGVEIVSWSQTNFLLGACQIQPPDWDPNRSFEERSKVRMFFGWDTISHQLTQSHIISMEISASSPFHALSIQTIQAIEDYLNSMFKQLNMPPLPVRAVPFNLQGRVDLRGWYLLSSGSNRAHYFSFLQYGNGLPEGQATCGMKVPYYELVAKEIGGKEMQFCNGCLRG